jgi:anti-sigma factor RsiW
MRCTKARRLISSYVDGEISKRERELLESHIKDCRACSKEVEKLRDVRGLFAHSERFSAPHGFSTRVLANVEANKTGGFQWIPLLKKFAGVIVVLVMISMGIISGGILGRSFSLQKAGNLVSSFSLDIFNATPPDSLGGVYLAMTEERNERQ